MAEYMVDYNRKHVVPLTQKPKGFEKSPVYYTHDNGGRPFAVYVNRKENAVVVYGLKSPKYFVRPQDEEQYKKTNQQWRLYTHRVLYLKNIEKIWIGKSDPIKNCHPPGNWAAGNSILVQSAAKNTYYFIGDGIYSFTSDEQITKLHSPVGNNDVPYPVAESGGTNGYYYFMLDQVRYPKRSFVAKEDHDLYFYFYGHGGQGTGITVPSKVEQFRNVKIVAPRQY